MEEWKWVRRSSETAAAVKTKAAPSQLARHGRSQPGDADHRMGSRENAAGRPPSPVEASGPRSTAHITIKGLHHGPKLTLEDRKAQQKSERKLIKIRRVLKAS
ncbi:hypothetical protein MRX96_019892 [Rhipicephalus microplus]